MSSLPAVEQLEIVESSWNGISNVFPTLFPGCAHGSGGFFIRLILLKHDEQNDFHRFTVGLYLQTKATILSLPSLLMPFAFSPSRDPSGHVQAGSERCPCWPWPKLPLDCAAFLADDSSVPGSFSCYPRFQLSRLEETSQNQDLLSELCPVHLTVIVDIFREEETRNH